VPAALGIRRPPALAVVPPPGTVAAPVLPVAAPQVPEPEPELESEQPAHEPGHRAQASKPVSLINSKESHDRPMQRLELESRVNQARWKLDFLERELAAISG
jgi:hypothetical protein